MNLFRTKSLRLNGRRFVKSIALITVGAMLFSCENDIDVVNSLKIADYEPVESSYDINMIMTDSGHVRIRMQSPEVNHYIRETEFVEMPKGIHVEFLDSSGKISSMLTAEYAISYEQSGIIEAKHNVVAMNTAGEKLYTEHLIWDQKKHIIFTEKEVKIETFDKILFGDGLNADEGFNNWEILNPRGEIIVKDVPINK